MPGLTLDSFKMSALSKNGSRQINFEPAKAWVAPTGKSVPLTEKHSSIPPLKTWLIKAKPVGPGLVLSALFRLMWGTHAF